MSTFKDASNRRSTTKEKLTVPSKSGSRKNDTTNKESSNKRKETQTKSSKTMEEKEVKKKLSSSKTPINTTTKLKQNIKNPSKSITKTKSSNIAAPSTPTSNRVKRTQYFPSKNLYSNALKAIEKEIESPQPKSHSTSSKEKAKKPVITKKANEKSRPLSPDSSMATERPGTATLRKPSIVISNIAGPTARELPIKQDLLTPSSNDNYEDDFESYESDFEAITSSDDTLSPLSNATGSITTSSEDIPEKRNSSPECQRKITVSSAGTDSERKLDSGTFEMADFKHRQILKYIEDTMKKEDSIVEQKEKCNHASLSDEGFEEQKSLQFINFVDAKKKCEQRRASVARKKRGQELLSMIKLDTISFTIFDSPSVPYEDFIKSYGQSNSIQVSTQTGKIIWMKKIQTEYIIKCHKWSQMPNRFSTFDHSVDKFWDIYREDYKGFGEVPLLVKEQQKINGNRLKSFIQQAGDLILHILNDRRTDNMENLHKNINPLPFSNGYLLFNAREGILSNTTIQNMQIHAKNSNRILTIHTNENLSIDSIKSILCIWNVIDPERPRTTLISFGTVSCATFHVAHDQFIFAGQTDGSILVWDIEKKNRIYDIFNRTPSFISDIGVSHDSKVVSIQAETEKKQDSNEICSLDDTGKIMLWNFYSCTEDVKSVILIRTRLIDLQSVYPSLSDFVCTDCILLKNHIYVSTNYGFILQFFLKGKPIGNKQFISELNINSTCLEICPFSSSHFLAGYSNGDISLFSTTTERPLLLLQNKEEMDISSIQMIQWSKTKPFVFYAKDSENNIHIWDLGKSDMYPEYSIRFPEKINCFKLSPIMNVNGKGESTYMLISTEDGKLYLYSLNEEYGKENYEKFQGDLKIFLNYVNRL
ncbi:hypothetical protein ABEB36_003682 [Hypothenemus hampei]|uniref:WD repeat-containing protein 60 n=1 Tax=Hypothenemus hampei TaxID=57062 RepID=A0ABD1F0S9_HYPHA